MIINCHNTVYYEEQLPFELREDLKQQPKGVHDGEFISLKGDLYDFLSARAKMDDRLAIRLWDTLSTGLNEPLSKRRAFLENNLRQTERVKLVPQEAVYSKQEILDCFEDSWKQGFEGIVVKPDKGYNAKWLKIKKLYSQDVVILAIKKTDDWLEHSTPRTFLTGYYDPLTGFKRFGDVSSGLTVHEKHAIGEVALTIKTGEDNTYVYIKPELVLEIAYKGKEENGLRESQIKRLRFDKKPKDCLLP